MIFYENFANFYDFSTNFCQLADFLPEGGGPRIFVKYSPVYHRQARPGNEVDKNFTQWWKLNSIYFNFNYRFQSRNGLKKIDQD